MVPVISESMQVRLNINESGLGIYNKEVTLQDQNREILWK